MNIHKVDSTTGIAKSFDVDARSLKSDWVPTIGHYIEAAGYESNYIGKWHLSEEDILDEDGMIIGAGTEGVNLQSLYEKKNRLKKFGFNGWKGPEPHGGLYRDSAFKRDPIYTKQAIEILKKYNNSESPFFLAINLVNPHDMVYFHLGLWRQFQEPINDFCPGIIDGDPLSKWVRALGEDRTCMSGLGEMLS